MRMASACQGIGLLCGATSRTPQMLFALASRADASRASPESRPHTRCPHRPPKPSISIARRGHSRARTLGALLVPLDEDYGIPLRRAARHRRPAWKPTVRRGTLVASLRALWASLERTSGAFKGIEIAAIGGRIHPHYGVFRADSLANTWIWSPRRLCQPCACLPA